MSQYKDVIGTSYVRHIIGRNELEGVNTSPVGESHPHVQKPIQAFGQRVQDAKKDLLSKSKHRHD